MAKPGSSDTRIVWDSHLESRSRKSAKFLARSLASRINRWSRVEPEGFNPDHPPEVDVVVYFPDMRGKIYQLLQWLPVFEQGAGDLKILLAMRSFGAYRELEGITTLPKVLVPRFEPLIHIYNTVQPKAVIYVNNGWTNFQSLSYQGAAHIHINHGESDKVSMVSNQAKAYDRVFVAGEMAIRRHRAALIWYDEDKLIRTGRPQLDLRPEPIIEASTRTTVLYAPTWAGESEINNYTSVEVYGNELVRQILDRPNTRLIYKPHPRVWKSRLIGEANARIVRQIEEASRRDPAAGHQVFEEGDILAMFTRSDVLISDVSSVGLDWLYLHTDRPLFITDRRTDRAQLAVDAPVSTVCPVIDRTTLGDFGKTLDAVLAEDTHQEGRQRLRDLYFDGLRPGESTQRFFEAIRTTIAEHDQALQGLVAARQELIDMTRRNEQGDPA